ncbi:DUF995 domain-containing protein [Maliponia aquimaris]|uniref:DUF995 domain-containing protein n=1 Tax=Maliponia aquimaris TaxID=1673631 RepID=A0A238KUY2_9RHOB|nr:DUF995 domain-containing protein [Maliponia aquimaris]SMX46605.1 hypothetical protein MAA8898_03454 [Maliponia aquimaris]
MKTFLKTILIAVLALAAVPGLAAGPDQKNAVSAEEVAALYADKTWIWSDDSDESGSYWGPKGQFEAVWKGSVGVGKWYATDKGNLCYEAKWKRNAKDREVVVKRCWRHVKDSTGAWWKQDPETRKWYDAGEELTESMQDGNQMKASVEKLRKKFGL